MPTVKLTDAAAGRLKAPSGARVDYFDGAFPGLALRVTGAVDQRPERRTWTLFYRFAGKQRRLTFEPGYPTLSLADARQAATKAQMQLRAGEDPAAAKKATKDKAARAPDTIASIVGLYIRHLERQQKSPVYIRETRRNLDNHVLPRWASRDARTITRRDVVELVNAVMDEGSKSTAADGKRRRLVGGPVMANRVLAAVRGMFNFALDEIEVVGSTPVRRMKGPGVETPRDRTLGADEMRLLWPQFLALGYPYGPALQLALVTGQRRQEVATMRWTDVDVTEGVWTLAGTNTKSGRLTVVPLSPLALEILAGLPRRGPFVFTSSNDKPICGFSSALARLQTIAKGSVAIEPWTIHDLRRTAATEMGRLGAPEFIISKVLNHAPRGITGTVYNRYEYLSEKRHVLECWAQYLDNLTRPAGENVVALHQVANG